MGWVATSPTAIKGGHLSSAPYASCSYWAPSHDFAVAECHAELIVDDAIRSHVWNLYKAAAPPLGYDPGGIGVPGWDTPTSHSFAVIRFEPWRLRALTGEQFRKSGSRDALNWVA
jgi:hypothetical protein